MKVGRRPRRAPSAYSLWLAEKRESIAESLGTNGPEVFRKVADSSVCSLPTSEAGELWREMSEEERAKYQAEASVLKAEVAGF